MNLQGLTQHRRCGHACIALATQRLSREVNGREADNLEWRARAVAHPSSEYNGGSEVKVEWSTIAQAMESGECDDGV